MRNLILVCLALPMLLMSCQSQEKKSVEELTLEAEANGAVRTPYDEDGNLDTANLAKFEWVEETHDFGQLTAGDVAKHTFKFKNVGNVPLSITNSVGSCGCTVADYTKTPVEVGEEGEVNVEFNSTSKSGNEVKQVTLSANTYPLSKTVLEIKAFVNKKKK